MDELRQKLETLEDWRLDYVIERSKTRTDKDAYLSAGVGRGTFYSIAQEEREKLNALAQDLKRESAYRALMILQDATEKAAIVKVEGLECRKDNIKQSAATEILDRMLGRAVQRSEITGKDGGDIPLRYVNDWRKAGEDE